MASSHACAEDRNVWVDLVSTWKFPKKLIKWKDVRSYFLLLLKPMIGVVLVAEDQTTTLGTKKRKLIEPSGREFRLYNSDVSLVSLLFLKLIHPYAWLTI